MKRVNICQHFVCRSPHSLMSHLEALTSWSGLLGCLMWRKPGWMAWKKPPDISPVLPEPCQGWLQKTGWSLGRPRQPTVSVNFVPWLPGTAGSKNKANPAVALPGTSLTSTRACPLTSLGFGSGFCAGWALTAKS